MDLSELRLETEEKAGPSDRPSERGGARRRDWTRVQRSTLRETVRPVTRVADLRATSLLSMHFCTKKQTDARLRDTIHGINQTL